MIEQTQGQMYLAGQRGVSLTPWFRSFHTFNFGSYQEAFRMPFGNLHVFNDDTLAAGKSIFIKPGLNMAVILIPVVGAIAFEHAPGETEILEAGQTLVLASETPGSYQITNPYDTALVNFIQIWLKNENQDYVIGNQQGYIGLETHNQLSPIFPLPNGELKMKQGPNGYMGKYDGRAEGIYNIQNPASGIFVFIIEGAFEVQNRLMEARDGLTLWNLDQLEFEALSNDAIILVLEPG